MRPCWQERGLTEKGARLADTTVLTAMEAIVECVGLDVASTVLQEANFRLNELPKRAASYRRKYAKENQT